MTAIVAAGGTAGNPAGTWTATIASFPHQAYTWHFSRDGTYREYGRDTVSGRSVQPTIFGHWHSEGNRVFLIQDSINYRFEGEILDGLYSGILYLDDRPFSRFCALRGPRPPTDCSHFVQSKIRSGAPDGAVSF